MHPIIASLPILVLIIAMTARAPRLGLPLPAHLALPGAAALALFLQVIAGPHGGPNMVAARIIEGALTALMPLAIVFGAVLLFRTLGRSGAMAAITTRLEHGVPDPVLRVVLIAWSFSYLVEGLSGFGTPAALAAPLLVGLGFPPVRAAATCLVMNTIPVVFGAVGMPIWFGLGELQLDAEQLRGVGFTAAIIQCAVAPVVVALALRLLFSWSDLRARALPIAIVIAATVSASTITAAFSVEFPTIIGGATALAVAFIIGRLVHARESGAPTAPPAGCMSLWRAAFPLIATVALLAVTRFEPFGLRDLLNAETPAATVSLGPLGELSVSPALVVRFEDILNSGISWGMAMLYVPFIIPFVVVVLLSVPVLHLSARETLGVAHGAARSLMLPAIALAGALVFVKLMMHGDRGAPVIAIGRALADAVAAVHEPLWLGAAPLVGALGSFFSGSATVSNLTFGPVQAEIAQRIDLESRHLLALQAVGAAMGNMVCVHNIVAVGAVLGLTRGRRSELIAPEQRSAQPTRATSSVEDPIATILRLNAMPLAASTLVAAVAATVLGAL